ncbi:hypothetical protein A3Q56_01248 [Intoshia linei]|uniref:ATP-dependent DNA helicase HFM1 n=1 Tax=Intoshia linei TaxID=1819745 RepID=A0A177BBK6_9BILA|nr:hypothetical protein A3Q56_01248 [Intoshia linei]
MNFSNVSRCIRSDGDNKSESQLYHSFGHNSKFDCNDQVAPTKAVCKEKVALWTEKFKTFSINTTEYTSDVDENNPHEYNIICATPEKWDSFTRKLISFRSIMAKVKLLVLDELQILGEESRGATVEVIVSRMKYLYPDLRILAISATMPNTIELCKWIKTETKLALSFKFAASFRPVPLKTIILCFPFDSINCSNVFKFDVNLSYKLSSLITKYSSSKPTLIFCASRSSVQNTASVLLKQHRLSLTTEIKNILRIQSSLLSDKVLQAELSLRFFSGQQIFLKEFFLHPTYFKTSHFEDLKEFMKISKQNILDKKKELDSKTTIIQLIESCNSNLFPNIHQLLIILVTLPITSCQCECSISILRRLKFFLRSTMTDLVLGGIAYHHAGINIEDRIIVEHLFRNAYLKILVATSTLAMGVNFPAHLVIVKSTKYYSNSGIDEYSILQINQMIGRAGRPQYDTSGIAIIMTTPEKKQFYSNLIDGMLPIKSQLENHITENLLVEIGLNNIIDFHSGVKWIKNTLWFIQNNQMNVEEVLRDCITKLEFIDAISNRKKISIKENGLIIVNHNISYDSMKNIIGYNGFPTIENLLRFMFSLKEFSSMYLRRSDKMTLNKLNNDSTNQLSLFQASLCNCKILDFSLKQDLLQIFRVGKKISKGLVQYFIKYGSFTITKNAIYCSRYFDTNIWHDSDLIIKQIYGIGIIMSNEIKKSGFRTLDSLRTLEPSTLQTIINRKQDFCTKICDSINSIPLYILLFSIYNIDKKIDVKVTIIIKNYNKVREQNNTDKIRFIIESGDRKLYTNTINTLYMMTDNWSRMISIDRKLIENGKITANLISENFVGCDQMSAINFKNEPIRKRLHVTERVGNVLRNYYPSSVSSKRISIKRLKVIF